MKEVKEYKDVIEVKEVDEKSKKEKDKELKSKNSSNKDVGKKKLAINKESEYNHQKFDESLLNLVNDLTKEGKLI